MRCRWPSNQPITQLTHQTKTAGQFSVWRFLFGGFLTCFYCSWGAYLPFLAYIGGQTNKPKLCELKI
jgi:hypothetical protein